MKMTKLLFAGFSVLVVVCILSISIKSYAEDKKGKEYHEAMVRHENEYVHEIRESLNDYGFKNAGINLTKEYDENRTVTYKLVINHHSLEYAENAKLNKMESEFENLANEYLTGSLNAEFTF